MKIRCVTCGKGVEISCTEEQAEAIRNRGGKYIQDVASYLKPWEREMFISGVCPECWDKMWGAEEE